MTTADGTVTLDAIEYALRNEPVRTFRARYPGSCACCGRSFKPRSIVYRLAAGLVCWDCVQTQRSHVERSGGYLPDVR